MNQMSKPSNGGGSGGQRPQHFLTTDDREWIVRRLADKRMSKAALARAVGMTRQNMYLMLNGEVAHTTDWPEIVAVLGGTPPGGSPPITDERLRAIVRSWSDMSEADRALTHEVIARLRAKKF